MKNSTAKKYQKFQNMKTAKKTTKTGHLQSTLLWFYEAAWGVVTSHFGGVGPHPHPHARVSPIPTGPSCYTQGVKNRACTAQPGVPAHRNASPIAASSCSRPRAAAVVMGGSSAGWGRGATLMATRPEGVGQRSFFSPGRTAGV